MKKKDIERRKPRSMKEIESRRNLPIGFFYSSGAEYKWTTLFSLAPSRLRTTVWNLCVCFLSH